MLPAAAQDSAYTRLVLQKLTSAEFAGRGYVDSGHIKAAQFIAAEFEKIGLQKINNTRFQNFTLSPNVFPSAMEVSIDNQALIPGSDYLVAPVAPSLQGTFNLVWLDQSIVSNTKNRKKFARGNYSKSFVVVDEKGIVNEDEKTFVHQQIYFLKAKGIVKIKDSKLTWSIAQKQSEDLLSIEIPREKISRQAKKISVNIKAQILSSIESSNVIGYIKGTQQPDSFVLISAHYDHLGKMGSNTYFPGANDNASGTSMLLNLAHYFSLPQNAPKCSLLFIAFSGEEIGLLGSNYYVAHPLFPLSQIKLQLNIDIIGDAGNGITVVNGKPFEKEFQQLVSINGNKKLLPSIQKRGEAANSDHYPFYNKGVKALFIYSRGKSTAYHDINDNFNNLPLVNYKACFDLFKEFIILQQ